MNAWWKNVSMHTETLYIVFTLDETCILVSHKSFIT